MNFDEGIRRIGWVAAIIVAGASFLTMLGVGPIFEDPTTGEIFWTLVAAVLVGLAWGLAILLFVRAIRWIINGFREK